MRNEDETKQCSKSLIGSAEGLRDRLQELNYLEYDLAIIKQMRDMSGQTKFTSYNSMSIDVKREPRAKILDILEDDTISKIKVCKETIDSILDQWFDDKEVYDPDYYDESGLKNE